MRASRGVGTVFRLTRAGYRLAGIARKSDDRRTRLYRPDSDSSIKRRRAIWSDGKIVAMANGASLGHRVCARVDYLQLGSSPINDIHISALDLESKWTVRLDSDLVSGAHERFRTTASELTVNLTTPELGLVTISQDPSTSASGER